MKDRTPFDRLATGPRPSPGWSGSQAAALLAAVLLAGCGRQAPIPARGDTSGDRLEAAALAAGIVADPARADPVGLYARGDDRMCVVPRAGGGYGVGILVRYDDAQGCTARGAATRAGDRLDVDLPGCRVAARFEGDRIVLPAALPDGCDRACTGRASLAALSVERLSDGVAEAGAQHDGEGNPLCAS